MTPDELLALLKDELKFEESETSEFKINNDNPALIGKNISALSNAAALQNKEQAYLIFGINDDGGIVGTKFRANKKYKNQGIKNWLATQVSPGIHFDIHDVVVDDKHLVVFAIDAATNYVAKFKSVAYVRVGSSTKQLSKHDSLEKALWQKLEHRSFEKALARSNLSGQDVIDMLDYSAYYDLKKPGMEIGPELALRELQTDGLIQYSKGKYAITNLGALLIAKDITQFEKLQRKLPRLIIYQGNNKIKVVEEPSIHTGYVLGIHEIMKRIRWYLPKNEVIEKVLREEHALYPEVAIRELLVNALIHQDFLITGMSPMVEIFKNRIEIRNPGVSLVSIERLIDASSQSRNEILAKQMRGLNFCEERGSGIDRVVLACEISQLPAPLFSVDDKTTHAVLYAPKTFTQMSKDDRVRATYQHACLKYVSGDCMTNKSLRERFGIPQNNYPQVSKIISYAVNEKLIQADPNFTSNRDKRYIPAWVEL